MKIPNPYAQPYDSWSPEVMAAYLSFPKNGLGMNEQICARTWPVWREWLKTHDKALWPVAAHAYIAEKKRQEKRQSGETSPSIKDTHIIE